MVYSMCAPAPFAICDENVQPFGLLSTVIVHVKRFPFVMLLLHIFFLLFKKEIFTESIGSAKFGLLYALKRHFNEIH